MWREGEARSEADVRRGVAPYNPCVDAVAEEVQLSIVLSSSRVERESEEEERGDGVRGGEGRGGESLCP